MTTFDTPHPIEARIDLTVGALHVNASDRATTRVEILPSDPSNEKDVEAAEQVEVELTGDHLVVRGADRSGLLLLRSWISRGWGGSTDVSVDLPTDSRLEARLGSVDVDATGRLAACRLRTGLGSIRLDETAALDCKTGSGDVTVARVTGHADITTASGEVRLGTLADSAVVRNSNGATRIADATDHLRVKAANGDIEIGRASSDVVAKSANGDLRVDEVVRGTVVLETHVGDVEVGIRDGTAAWLDLDATTGSVDNRLAAGNAPDDSSDTLKVRARTTLGHILVRRPEGAARA